MRQKLILIFFLFLCSCVKFTPQWPGARQKVDECNFHVGQWGTGVRWKSLPIPLTIHQRAMDERSVPVILNVVEDWNDTWRRESGQNQGLFEVLGFIDYNHVADIYGDRQSTIAFVYPDQNISRAQSGGELLRDGTQGITTLNSSGFSKHYLKEADMFLNASYYKFHYDDADDVLAQESLDSNRGLASLEEPQSIFSHIRKFLGDLFSLIWKRTGERQLAGRKIPSEHLDFESLFSHELGHVAGLGHNEIRGSMMNAKLKKGTTRRGVRQIDMDSLLCGYAGKR